MRPVSASAIKSAAGAANAVGVMNKPQIKIAAHNMFNPKKRHFIKTCIFFRESETGVDMKDREQITAGANDLFKKYD
jgi:hypothetical protein